MEQKVPEQYLSSFDSYLETHELVPFLTDAYNKLLESDEPWTEETVNEELYSYFTSVRRGKQALGREAAFILATARNRLDFGRTLYSAFLKDATAIRGATDKEMPTPESYAQLLTLLCPDFPIEFASLCASILVASDRDIVRKPELEEYHVEEPVDFICALTVLFLLSDPLQSLWTVSLPKEAKLTETSERFPHFSKLNGTELSALGMEACLDVFLSHSVIRSLLALRPFPKGIAEFVRSTATAKTNGELLVAMLVSPVVHDWLFRDEAATEGQ